MVLKGHCFRLAVSINNFLKDILQSITECLDCANGDYALLIIQELSYHPSFKAVKQICYSFPVINKLVYKLTKTTSGNKRKT